MTSYVLVHGAWHDARAWSRVIPLLGRAGHDAIAPDLTGHGQRRHLLTARVDLSTHIDDVVRLIESEDLRGVVLVGHSYAGVVITGVAERVPARIAQLILVDAMVPEDGENAVDLVPPTQHLIDAAARTEHPWRVPPIPPSPDAWFGVSDEADRRWLRTLVGDESLECFQQRIGLREPAARLIDRAHVHCVGGRAAAAGARRPVPERQPNGKPSVVRELRTGHDCMITAPEALTALLLQLVEQR